MLFLKIQVKQIRRLFIIMQLLVLFFSSCSYKNNQKSGVEAISIEAESYLSNSGNITVFSDSKDQSTVKTHGDLAWLNYKINIPISGRYRVRLYGKNIDTKEANCWIEDYINNKDGRTYNITGNLSLPNKKLKLNEFTQTDGVPFAAGLHYLKVHIENGDVILDKLTLSLIKEHSASPIVRQQNTDGKTWQLVWSDEFNGSGLPDSTKWTFDIGNWGWGNNELQYYTSDRLENARQENGNLILEARKNDLSYPWSSARLTTRGKESFLYGKIEIRAKVPVGRGSWSAGWLLGDEYIDEMSWPYCGEIDVMENVGYEIDSLSTRGKTHASIHCGAYYFKLRNQPTAIVDVKNMSTEFHTYTLVWMPDSLTISVDGNPYFNYHDTSSKHSWPFNKPQNLILNLAIGGGWGGTKGLDGTMTSQKLIFDYVRVFELK
jgi:beta-glucanase (GH16 family)